MAISPIARRGGDCFSDELTWLLVNQRAAFNSPVWFNLGVPDAVPQSSACFILSVDDTLESILNWYVEEGLIFRGGSGSGVNLGRIRSSREHLSGGGTPSGPVSFMRGADASAGTIKSGGKTRRAAKMVVLDIDHPDVREFIWCKAREEHKARALRAAGFDVDFDGDDAHSLQYQNANNSVRLSDEFMAAVEHDAQWELIGRTTGEIIERVPARELFAEIAQASWECADPGVQFSTTINRWHTAANTGPITASNPCSEYVHLDNSACNLSSLNLLAFTADDGTFDVACLPRRRGHHGHGTGDPGHPVALSHRPDRRHHPPVPSARPRIRQPRRAAHGARLALRLRRGSRHRCRHHRPHDRRRLCHLGPHREAVWGPSPATTTTPNPCRGCWPCIAMR